MSSVSTPAPALVADYIYGQGLTSQTASLGTYYYDFDSLGSTTGESNSAGGYVNTYAFSPFGGSLSSYQVVANPFQFVGQAGVMADPDGLQFMHARYMVAVTGRFTSSDPLGARAPNDYAYGDNNPVSATDPSGLATVTGPYLCPPIIITPSPEVPRQVNQVPSSSSIPAFHLTPLKRPRSGWGCH